MCPTFRDRIDITLASAAIDVPAFRDRIEIALTSAAIDVSYF